MVVIRKKPATKKPFANMMTVIRLHLMSYVGLLAFIKDTYKAWRKTHNASFDFLRKQMGGAPPESDIISLSLYALTTKHTS
jgi:hypothetical protein